MTEGMPFNRLGVQSGETVATDEMGKINLEWMFGANGCLAVAGTIEVGKK